jgi:GNAT superfamily N-acetyltransferase
MQTLQESASSLESRLSVRQLRSEDLAAADRIVRQAFDTFTGIQELFGTRDFVHGRWRARPDTAIAAELDGEVVGSNFVTIWGTVGFLGPLSVRTDLWDHGVGKALMAVTLDLFEARGTRHAGLFTFPQSPKHVGLYQKFGFWPRQLTPILTRRIDAERSAATGWTTYSAATDSDCFAYERACDEVTYALREGLSLTSEIRAVRTLGLGDTILVEDGSALSGFAVCHVGRGSEAGADLASVKFAAVRPEPRPEAAFARLLDACEMFAATRGVKSVELGVNTACREAYRAVLARGYRAGLVGVAMERPDDAAYHRPGAYVVGDWR